jgi:predicted RNA-binding Zn-ribbon protein involved in translation (DUF1610 family)
MLIEKMLIEVDLVALVESSLGKAREVRGSWAKFRCPFCGGVRVENLKPVIVKSLLVINNENQKGFFTCHNCHAAGDAISWLRKYKRLSYAEAVHALETAKIKHSREAIAEPVTG